MAGQLAIMAGHGGGLGSSSLPARPPAASWTKEAPAADRRKSSVCDANALGSQGPSSTQSGSWLEPCSQLALRPRYSNSSGTFSHGLKSANFSEGTATMWRLFLGLLVAYAAVGLALSLFVHAASFVGTPPGGETLFFGLHAAIFPLWIPVVFIAMKMSGGIYRFGRQSSWGYWKRLVDGAPIWMQLMTAGFFAYALVNFAIFFLMIAGHGQIQSQGAPPAIVWRGFSGHWMVFYSAGLTIATAAYLRGPENLVPRCPNGHAVSLTDRYCPECGAEIPPK